jgi:hypothetical protein
VHYDRYFPARGTTSRSAFSPPAEGNPVDNRRRCRCDAALIPLPKTGEEPSASGLHLTLGTLVCGGDDRLPGEGQAKAGISVCDGHRPSPV